MTKTMYGIPVSTLRKAAAIYAEEECEQLPGEEFIAEFDKKYPVSDEAEKAINKALKKAERPFYYCTNTVGKRVAVFFITLLIAFTAAVFSVKAIRDPLINYAEVFYNEYISVIYYSKADNLPSTIEKYYRPSYLPEGFSLFSVATTATDVRIIYRAQDGQEILFVQRVIDDLHILIDTEDVGLEYIYINGRQGIFASKYSQNKVTWDNNIYGFSISGIIDKNELIKAAESVEFYKNK